MRGQFSEDDLWAVPEIENPSDSDKRGMKGLNVSGEKRFRRLASSFSLSEKLALRPRRDTKTSTAGSVS
jgi:hypothetical protein